MSPSSHFILAIEAAIAGGSVSLLHGDSAVAHWIGNAGCPEGRGVACEYRRSAAVQRDNGGADRSGGGLSGAWQFYRHSHRVCHGGLKNGLGIPMSSISILRAMVIAGKTADGDVETVAAVPVGRSGVCFQSFRFVGSVLKELGEASDRVRRSIWRVRDTGNNASVHSSR